MKSSYCKSQDLWPPNPSSTLMFFKHRQAELCHAQELPGYKGHRMEGKLPETSFLLKAVVVRRMKSFQVCIYNPAVDGLSFKGVGLPGERHGAEERSQEAFSGAGCSLRWDLHFGLPVHGSQRGTKGATRVHLVHPLGIPACLQWLSNSPG